MTEREREQRAAVVAEARTWLRTKYHHAARIKGVGCDCLTLIAGIYEGAGLVPPLEIPPYSAQYGLHVASQTYIEGLRRHAREVPEVTGPGDVVLWRFGRSFSHTCLVVDWPHVVIHANARAGMVELADATKAPFLEKDGSRRERVVFTLWGA
jgi:NlpC/P60 family putative phage cell wall peptidase